MVIGDGPPRAARRGRARLPVVRPSRWSTTPRARSSTPELPERRRGLQWRRCWTRASRARSCSSRTRRRSMSRSPPRCAATASSPWSRGPAPRPSSWRRRVEPALVLLDLNLPDTDGRDVCRELRRHVGRPDRDAHRARHRDRSDRRPRAGRRRLRREAVQRARGRSRASAPCCGARAPAGPRGDRPSRSRSTG